MHAEQNLYPGVNPHLNSFLQQPDGGWESFHARFISLLTDSVEAALPDAYYAIEEKSLQIMVLYADETPAQRPSRTTPDVVIFRVGEGGHREVVTAPLGATMTPTLTLSVEETFVEEDSPTSVMIYRLKDGKVPGEPVTRLELLSPGNKPGGAHYAQYLAKRQYTLRTGIRLVEIDFLHETPPLLRQIPNYAAQDSGAKAYNVLVSNPHPDLSQGKTDIFTFGVSDHIPSLDVPLTETQHITVDFGAVYNQTVASRRLFYTLADYAQTPINFGRYTDADQAWIKEFMAQILQRRSGV